MSHPANLAKIDHAVIEERTYVRGVVHSYTDAYFNTYVLIRTKLGSSWSDFLPVHLGLDGHEEPLYATRSGPAQTYASIELALDAVSAHWDSWEMREASQDRRFAEEGTGATDRTMYEGHHQLRRMRRSDGSPEEEPGRDGGDGIARWLDDGGATRPQDDRMSAR